MTPHKCLVGLLTLLATLGAAARADDLLQVDPWKQLSTSELWDASKGDVALRGLMRKLEAENSQRPLQLASLIDQMLVKDGESPKWSMASADKQIFWLGAPVAVNQGAYRVGFGVLAVDKVTPTRLVDKEYAKSWMLTMSNSAGLRHAPIALKIEVLTVFDQAQAMNNLAGVDLRKYLTKHGLEVKTLCSDAGTQYEVAHLLVRNRRGSVNLLYAHTGGTGQESITYLMRWGDVTVNCKNLDDFGM